MKDGTLFIKRHAVCCELQNTDDKQKALCVFLRLLSCPQTGKELFTDQQIAEGLGKHDRRDSETFGRDFRKRGGDFLRSFGRKKTKKEGLFPLIERQVLDAPVVSPAEHDRMFCETSPQERIGEATCRRYVNAIAVTPRLKRFRQRGFKDKQSLDMRRYLQELPGLPVLSRAKRTEVVENCPEGAPLSTSPPRGHQRQWLSSECWASQRCVVVVDSSGLSPEMLALLFDVSKTSIHNWIYSLCSEDVEWPIIGKSTRWSRQVSLGVIKTVR